MIDAGFIVPLSPPTSPYSSIYGTMPTEDDWQSSSHRAGEHTPPHSDSGMAVMQEEAASNEHDLKRPSIRSHKSFPYLLDSKTHSNSDGLARIDEVESHDLPAMTFGGSAPTSPISRLTPPSVDDGALGESMDDEGDDIIDLKEEGADSDVNDDKPLTAAEIRAAKRKMKRFRLTHNQTRFLMSEFARQAHPDAAHRERLSREIPGLSPRQVQVWFQNRRAKLKRLTSDDRERMMRSRALPDDFDMAQALHAPFANSHGLGTPLASPAGFSPTFSDAHMMRPLSIDTLRRGPLESHMSPSSAMSPAFGGFAFTPPQSATETLSPVSAHDSSPFGFPSAPLDGSPRTSNPFSLPTSTPSAYSTHHNIPRLSLHAERIVRSRADSLNSPLRSNMGYGHGSSSMHGSDSHNEASRSFTSSMLPYGIGYSYAPVPGFQAASSNRLRSFSNGMPRRIELSTHYTPSRNSSTPQTAQFPSYSSAPLVTPHSYAMAQLSAPHHLTTFSHSYMRNDPSHSGQHYLGDMLEHHSDHDTDDGTERSYRAY